MPRPAKEVRKYEIQNLWDKHHQALRLLVLGVKPKDVAAQVNLTPQMISILANSTIGKSALMVMRGVLDKSVIDVKGKIDEMAPKALEVIEELLDCNESKIRLAAAVDVLDRAGYAPPKQVNVGVTHKVTQEDIEAIKRRAIESGLLAIQKTETVIDAEIIEESATARSSGSSGSSSSDAFDSSVDSSDSSMEV